VPIHVGQFDPIRSGDVVDLYLDISADLDVGESISDAAFTVTDDEGVVVANVVTIHTESGGRTSFRVTAPAAGGYLLTSVLTISDGQRFTRVADLVVV
jgi:hypothetical protein